MKRLAMFLVVAATLLFAIRGVLPGLRRSGPNDFFGLYTISRAWVAGSTLYSTQTFISTWESSFGHKAGPYTQSLARQYTALPPSIPFLAPLGCLPWRVANAVWVLVSALIFVNSLWLLRPNLNNVALHLILLYFAISFWLDPVRIGLAVSNATPLVVGLLGISYYLQNRRSYYASGILLGIAASFKPHLAFVFLILLLVHRKWTIVVAAIATTLAAFCLFAARLAAVGTPWWNDFWTRMAAFAPSGSPNDFSLSNSQRYQLLNLQVVIASITQSRTWSNVIAGCVVIVLAIACVKWSSPKDGNVPLLSFATINVIGLLPFYHRTYDATILVFVLAWVFSLESIQLKVRLLVVALIGVFLQPLPTLLIVYTDIKSRELGLVQEPWFRTFILCHEIWAILLLAITLITLMYFRNLARSVECAAE